MSQPIHLRPPEHPRAVALLNVVAASGALLLIVALPTWWLMHGFASGWQDERVVEVHVAVDAPCRTGPPPGSPRTCDGIWLTDGDTTSGEVSDRYGGATPRPGETTSARIVRSGGDPMTFTGFHPALLHAALASPYVAASGLLLVGGSVAALMRLDPRWRSARTDLPAPGSD